MIDHSVAKPVADMLTLCHFWSDDDIFQCKASLIMLFKAYVMIQTHASRCRRANVGPVLFCFAYRKNSRIFVILFNSIITCLRTSSLQVFIHEYTYRAVSSDLSLSVWTFKTCSYLITMEGHWSTPPSLSDLLNWTTKAKSICTVTATKKTLLCTYLFIFFTATALSLRL